VPDELGEYWKEKVDAASLLAGKVNQPLKDNLARAACR